MSKPSTKVNLKMPTIEEDESITAAAESDSDALTLTDQQLSEMVPCGCCEVVQSWQLKNSLFQSDIVLRLLPISRLPELAGKLVWMLRLRNMLKLTRLEMQRGPNIKMQKTEAKPGFYAEILARF